MRKISFPHMGNYFYALKPLIDLLGGEVIVLPPITKRTMELGFKHSPEAACIPFKYNLGNYIEALDMGANTLIQAGGGCRFGYYGEVQKEILNNLGYKFDFIKLTNNLNLYKVMKVFEEINPKMKRRTYWHTVMLVLWRLRYLDKVEDFVRINVGFQIEQGGYESRFKKYLKDLSETKTLRAVRKTSKDALFDFRSIKLNKPKDVIKVGVVGELYVVMEPFSNFFLEKELSNKGIEVHRFVTVTNILKDFFMKFWIIPKHLWHAYPYLKRHVGAHGTESVAIAHELVKRGFDGLIHVKPFACMPEVNAMPALHRLSKDYQFPIIYFSFDSQTSETGIKTRLEAFYDMLMMKKEKQKEKNAKHKRY